MELEEEEDYKNHKVNKNLLLSIASIYHKLFTYLFRINTVVRKSKQQKYLEEILIKESWLKRLPWLFKIWMT